eukprot:gnl/MRDRNA2_/MRDRNA2_120579_c0_seq1.p1 gnl/MRDRNA2_/MRDRNA2_120579_c0~~gnl/MRDRNA2_/MRDRNA2_120579_c0_seq1.p1  ORF type:complete len:880 (-),score=105.36 gnl/MRDRNA2_/MRDRNA2_120579_c0_seq1:35-2674(-)
MSTTDRSVDRSGGPSGENSNVPSGQNTPRSGQTGGSQTQTSFGELLIQCDVYTDHKTMFVNYDRVSRMFNPNSENPGAMVSALEEEIAKVDDFSEQQAEILEAEIGRMMSLIPVGTRLGQRGNQQAQNQTTGSAVWRWFSAKVKGQQTSVSVGDVERCYLAAHEHLRYLRMNTEAVSRLAQKVRLVFPNRQIGGLSEEPNQTFTKHEQKFHHFLGELESIYPVEALPQLRLQGEGQAQPSDEKSVLSTVVGKSFLYYSIVIALAVPICFWAYTSATHRERCLCMLCLMLLLNLSQAVPLYCTALSVPFFSMIFRVFPEDDLVKVTQQILGVMFSPVVFVILVMLTINTIMIKCQMELRFANFLSRTSVSMHSPMFLLLLMVGTMIMAAFCSAGFLMMGAIVPQLRDLPEQRRSTAKCILLGIMMAANIGGTLLPLSSPQGIIALSALREFNTSISMLSWLLFALPVCTIALLGGWVIIIFLIGLPARNDDKQAATPMIYKVSHFTWGQLFFLALSVAFLVGLVFGDQVDKYLGGMAILSFLFLFICYGTGFCTTTDFNELNWDVVICIAGSNALNHAMNMSGLATWLASQLLTHQDIVQDYIWLNSVKITAFVMIMASFFGQTCSAIIFLPFVLPLAVSLYAPETVALMCVVGITCAVAFPFSSSDNYVISSASRDDFRRRYLSFVDVMKVGAPLTVFCFILIITLGYFIAITHFGLPPKHILKSTPAVLQPSVKAWDEGQALEARLRAIENRYEQLEKRSGIHYKYPKEEEDSFLTVNQSAWTMHSGLIQHPAHPSGIISGSDPHAFLSIKSFGHLVASDQLARRDESIKSHQEQETRKASTSSYASPVQVRNYAEAKAPKDKRMVKAKTGVHMHRGS